MFVRERENELARIKNVCFALAEFVFVIESFFVIKASTRNRADSLVIENVTLESPVSFVNL